MDEIRELAGKYLGVKISRELFDLTLPEAAKKLEWIISREGDLDGERLQPYYIAQIIAEVIRGKVMTMCCMQDYEDKKRAAHKVDSSNQHPHCSMA